jgi:hypothetical protein
MIKQKLLASLANPQCKQRAGVHGPAATAV